MLNLFVLEPEPVLAPRLAAQATVRIVGTAHTPRTVLDTAPDCDLLLVSARLPRDEIAQFVGAARNRRIVIVDVEETEDTLLPLLESGAVGYVRQGAPTGEMLSTLNAIHSGKLPLAPPIGTALVERIHELLALQQQSGENLAESCPDLAVLTAREREILRLIRNGASNRDIAQELTIELGTVKNHVHNILKKLNVSRREQAALYVELFDQASNPVVE